MLSVNEILNNPKLIKYEFERERRAFALRKTLEMIKVILNENRNTR